MGKGDIKTKRGKIAKGSYGTVRQKKKKDKKAAQEVKKKNKK